MKILEISDDSGFIGVANYERYNAFISADWDFKMIERRIIDETNSNNILFWATGLENIWKVKLGTETSNLKSYREDKGVIEITNGKLHLTNYDTLTMAAQFEDIMLPESHDEDLFIELENGKYLVTIRQLFNPDEFERNIDNIDFEVIFMKLEKGKEIYNNINKIFWLDY